MQTTFTATVIAYFFLVAPLSAETTWPQFRGPDGQGRSQEVDLPLHWDETNHVVWKTPLQGQGWSSPVVSEGKVWLTAATEVKSDDVLTPTQRITLWAIEVDFVTGKFLQQIQLLDVQEPQAIHALNSYASPTPVLAAGRLYCHFGDYGTVCLETATGKILWRRRLQLDHRVGPASSPLLVDDLLILTCDGADQQYITALNTSDGQIAWHTDRPPLRTDNPESRKSFSTPLLISVQGEDQLVIPGAQWCIAYAPRTGKELWRVDHGSGYSIVPCPVFDGHHVFLCTGYDGPELWAIRADGHGDVTDTHVVWKQTKQIPTMPSPVLVNQRIYTISDAGIAQCFDTRTGDPLWKKRLGGKYSASPLYADQKIYFCNHDGRTTILATGDTYQELATNDLDGQLMASPVPVNGDLLLRTESHLYRIGK